MYCSVSFTYGSKFADFITLADCLCRNTDLYAHTLILLTSINLNMHTQISNTQTIANSFLIIICF